jgi:hypothetical protein
MEEEQFVINNNINDSVIVNTDTKVKLITYMKIIGSKTELPIEIVADFKNIPESYHEIYFDMFKYEYMGDIVIHNNVNPKSEVKEIKKSNKLVEFLTKKIGLNL